MTKVAETLNISLDDLLKQFMNKNAIFNHDQLHTAISLYFAARVMEENEKAAWEPLMKYISDDKVPPDKGQILMIKNISIGAIIIFAYAVENIVKAFTPEIKQRHINVQDIPYDLELDEVESISILKTMIPLLKNGFLRYHQPNQEKIFLNTHSIRKIFIKFFRYYTKKYSINWQEVKCFKVEFLKFNYPFIDDLMK